LNFTFLFLILSQLFEMDSTWEVDCIDWKKPFQRFATFEQAAHDPAVGDGSYPSANWQLAST